MKAKRGCGLLRWLGSPFSMLWLRPGLLHAADSAGTEMSLALNAGESYVINNVAPGEAPAVKVVTNPHALVVHNEEPGKVVLLGAEAGEWNKSITPAAGEKINYDVAVKSIADSKDIDHPGTAPAAIAGSGMSTGSAAPATAKMDEGAGPVASSAAASASSESSPAAGSITTKSSSDTVTVAASSAPAPIVPAN